MRGRLGKGAAADVVVVLGAFAVLGLVGGLLWWLAVDPAVYTIRRGEGGALMGELDLSKRFSADGWYSVIAIVGGFLSGVGLTWWRSRDFRLTTLLLVPGAALAAALMAYVGGLLGPGDTQVGIELAQPGDTVPVELAVSTSSVYLMWPIAVLAGALMVLWSSSVDPMSRRSSEPEPDAPRPSYAADPSPEQPPHDGEQDSWENAERTPR